MVCLPHSLKEAQQTKRPAEMAAAASHAGGLQTKRPAGMAGRL